MLFNKTLALYYFLEKKVPACTIKQVRIPRYLSKGVVFTMDSFCALGILFAIGLFVFNFKHRNVR